jgi:hypothetical protein
MFLVCYLFPHHFLASNLCRWGINEKVFMFMHDNLLSMVAWRIIFEVDSFYGGFSK